MEICLFKEVINVNPFTSEGAESIEEWGKVGENTALALGLPNAISAWTCKQKVQAQVGYFRADDTKNIKKLVTNVGCLMGNLCSFECFVLKVYVRVNRVNALILFEMKITYIVVIQKIFHPS